MCLPINSLDTMKYHYENKETYLDLFKDDPMVLNKFKERMLRYEWILAKEELQENGRSIK